MSDQQANNKALSSPPFSTVWCQTQNEVVKLKFVWTIHQFAFIKTFEKWEEYRSSEFFHEKNHELKWILRLFDEGSNMKVTLDEKSLTTLVNPVRVTIAILNKKREKIFPQQIRLPPRTRVPCCVFQIANKSLVESHCYVNGKLIINCEIEYFIPKDPALSGKSFTVADCPEKPFSNSDRQLVAQLEGLYENMKFSDFTINIRGRQFKAHKSILAARSPFFAAMFEHPTKENLTHQVEIENVEPDVFNEILRFIYTGKVSESTMEKMPFEIFAVADKYLLDQLKIECETQLIHQMSAENCLELLLNTHEHHPAFHLRKYAVEYFRQFSGEVMAMDEWEKAKEDDPEQCYSVLKDLVKSLV